MLDISRTWQAMLRYFTGKYTVERAYFITRILKQSTRKYVLVIIPKYQPIKTGILKTKQKYFLIILPFLESNDNN